MVRLFLKLYGLLIGTLAFSFLVQIQLMDYVWREMSHGYDFRTRFQPTFQLLERSLAGLPQADWPERVGGSQAPGAFSDEQRASLATGAIVWSDREGGGFRLSKKLDASPYIATL